MALAEAVLPRARFGPPAAFAAAVARFAGAVGADEALLGLDVVVAAGRWWFTGMTPLPDLLTAGDVLVDALLALATPVPARRPVGVA